jgi:hypothetical protein
MESSQIKLHAQQQFYFFKTKSLEVKGKHCGYTCLQYTGLNNMSESDFISNNLSSITNYINYIRNNNLNINVISNFILFNRDKITNNYMQKIEKENILSYLYYYKCNTDNYYTIIYDFLSGHFEVVDGDPELNELYIMNDIPFLKSENDYISLYNDIFKSLTDDYLKYIKLINLYITYNKYFTNKLFIYDKIKDTPIDIDKYYNIDNKIGCLIINKENINSSWIQKCDECCIIYELSIINNEEPIIIKSYTVKLPCCNKHILDISSDMNIEFSLKKLETIEFKDLIQTKLRWEPSNYYTLCMAINNNLSYDEIHKEFNSFSIDFICRKWKDLSVYYIKHIKPNNIVLDCINKLSNYISYNKSYKTPKEAIIDCVNNNIKNMKKQGLYMTKEEFEEKIGIEYIHYSILHDLQSVLNVLNEITLFAKTKFKNNKYKTFSNKAIEWMNEISVKDKVNIIYMGINGLGEIKIPYLNYTVDGYCKEHNIIYEFKGCLHHACKQCYNLDQYNFIVSDFNKLIYDNTLKRENFLKKLGFNLRTIWECEYNASKTKEKPHKTRKPIRGIYIEI